MDARSMETLIYINVPQSGYEVLIQQQGFQHAAALGQPRSELLRCETIVERLWAEDTEHVLWIRQQMNLSELSSVAETQFPWSFEEEDRSIIEPRRGAARRHLQVAAHAQVYEHRAFIQREHKIFAPSAYIENRAAADASSEGVGRGLGDVPLPSQGYTGNALTGEGGKRLRAFS
jgi:hypothetical protein